MKKKIPLITFSVFAVNFLLFIIKLYVGLSSNSISIYSDGVNNFFDSLTGILSFFMLTSLTKKSTPFISYRLKKTEQLLNFIVSVCVAFSAFYFAYNSLERLTYPTPVTFSMKYFYIILFTALVKLIMFFALKVCAEKSDSSLVSLISLDSLLDFFITAMTLLTLILSKEGKYTVDAYCGIIISITVLFTAVKSIISYVKLLTESAEKSQREALEEILEGYEVEKINFDSSEEETVIYIHIAEEFKDTADVLREEIVNKTDIKPYFIICNK